jgi:predicted enzyme related to lactoylglutathione lyase
VIAARRRTFSRRIASKRHEAFANRGGRMNPVTHFEMPYDDPGRLAKFYKAAFGWKMKMLGKEMGGYVLATTSETSADGMPKRVGIRRS